MPRRIPSNSDDIIDSRSIISRIEDLESELTSEWESDVGESNYTGTFDEWLEHQSDPDAEDNNEFTDEAEELKVLKALASECEGCGDWRHGETLIRSTYFREYAEDLAYDLCCLPPDPKWPLNHIDWRAAADELELDYTTVDFDGVDYLIRS